MLLVRDVDLDGNSFLLLSSITFLLFHFLFVLVCRYCSANSAFLSFFLSPLSLSLLSSLLCTCIIGDGVTTEEEEEFFKKENYQVVATTTFEDRHKQVFFFANPTSSFIPLFCSFIAFLFPLSLFSFFSPLVLFLRCFPLPLFHCPYVG